MIEIDDPEIRAKRLRELIGIEDSVWVQVENFDKAYAIANEGVERENEQKTSAIYAI